MSDTSESERSISSRKESHVRTVVDSNVGFREKSAGWDSFEVEFNALPEIDAGDVDTGTTFLEKALKRPFMITGMTGGYADAERINAALAAVCSEFGIAMGVGSQRQALHTERFHRSFLVVRSEAPNIPLLANIGAAEIAGDDGVENARRVVDLIQADAIAIHLNALQELLQPEGTPRFRGVLRGIEKCVRGLSVPIVVKEVGAGISGRVAQRLLDVGVRHIDVAGAGGTSWAGVELRRADTPHMLDLWDAGIPTSVCVREVCALRSSIAFTCIASGGVMSGFDAAKAIALGADIAGAARPFLQALEQFGEKGLHSAVNAWDEQFRAVMFIAGARTLSELQNASLRSRNGDKFSR